MTVLINPYRFASSGPALTYDQQVAADSPSGYWKLDDTSGTTVADSSGNARSLSRGSTATLNAAAIMPSGARSIDFAGDGNSYLLAADADWMSPHAGASGQMTLEAWINVDSLATIRTFWWKGVAGTFEYGFAVTTTGTLQFFTFTTAGAIAGIAESAASSIAASTSYHVAGTWDRAGNSIKVYINGAVAGSGTTSANTTNSTYRSLWGWRDSNTDRFYDGRLSHLALYPTALSGSRIAAHYAAA